MYLGVEAMELLDAYGIPTPEDGLAKSPEAASAIAADIGGVRVGVPAEDVPQTYTQIRERATKHNPGATVLGVRVEELQRVSHLATDFPAITELDINPLVVAPSGACAVDLRLTVDTADLPLSE